MMIKRFGDGRDWFFKQRFGMFVHWGIYSVAGWQEQMHWRGHMLSKDYVIYKDQFNPVKYNPRRMPRRWHASASIFRTSFLYGVFVIL